MDLTNDDVLKILSIIDESDYQEIRLEIGDLKLHVQKDRGATLDGSAFGPVETLPRPSSPPSPVSLPAPASAPAARRELPPAPVQAEAVPEGCVVVVAPILGTFYRASAPGEKPFVEVGAKIGANDTVCLIEVMKLFNSVKAGVAGTVVKILAENGSMVEHGQALVYVKPDA